MKILFFIVRKTAAIGVVGPVLLFRNTNIFVKHSLTSIATLFLLSLYLFLIPEILEMNN
ncbi:MAG: hypothetical protein QM802_01690 [Agriterribacter sp.]